MMTGTSAQALSLIRERVRAGEPLSPGQAKWLLAERERLTVELEDAARLVGQQAKRIAEQSAEIERLTEWNVNASEKLAERHRRIVDLEHQRTEIGLERDGMGRSPGRIQATPGPPIPNHRTHGAHRMIVKFRKLHQRARAPVYAKPGDSGADLRAVEAFRLKPGEPMAIPLGIAIELPPPVWCEPFFAHVTFEAQIRPRSSMSKAGVYCALGTIDNGYRGELGATLTLVNTGHLDFEIHIGDKIAQLVIAPVVRVEFEEAHELSQSERGQDGWGSSGR